jgi:hypothetical protein
MPYEKLIFMYIDQAVYKHPGPIREGRVRKVDHLQWWSP